ncbi:MAG: 5-formyltetrahydrofolate cyclo-ligase [Gemmatimonadales bacterium]|nr:5-formyltetrahydrofolate cyclo-ligase [Gemmatimonadales bacterium]NIN12257.1 5-formyltetrahydrofolate cyclo-ligase [Gemmatimonadales bacterium]NIN50659.1 5-formyltetrahydrofolate cyclo-ligase [Gemmatimonadales bacterium]NIP08123.1 5-formyltetrahydrofolate cyclo-ligase [Gemmatimonadales bacterium]NIR03416.1 5-formyltetrahydrofolate cyclo-ligase [Gemmatimonadales bacterium]
MDKHDLRQRIWDLLRDQEAARFPGAHGRIPNFTGAEDAALLLAKLPEWQSAHTLKANPDLPQLPVRAFALQQGKTVYMAVPRLRQQKCFIELDPERVTGSERRAASIKGSFRFGRQVDPHDMPKIDLVVAGSVAVRRDGARLGKGGGYSDLEFGLAQELGLVGTWTTIVTTVHPLQLTDMSFPMMQHDIPLDVIVTPAETIRCKGQYPRPPGILWESLTPEKVDAIPILQCWRP